MDLSVSSTVAYPALPAYAQQTGAGRREPATEAADSASQRSATRAELSPASLEAQKAEEEEARRKDPAAEVSRSPGFKFEYQDNHQVMKVHNSKGVLIYQAPSKGQLALLRAEDDSGQALRITA